MATFNEILEQAEALADAHRPLAAIRVWETAARESRTPGERGLLLYNAGCFYRSAVGDGVRARSRLVDAYHCFAETGHSSEAVHRLWSNTCENLMLLSLSFEEHDHWASELRRLHPAADILRGLLPETARHRDRGNPWHDALEYIARSYYDRADPQHDAGLYGEAASTYHLLLVHRKELRVPREDWRRAAIEYGTLCIRVGTDTSVKAERKNPLVHPRESVPLVRDALPLMDAYLSANPEDREVADLRKSMQHWAQRLEEAEPPRQVYGPRHDAETPWTAEPAIALRCAVCGQMIETPTAPCPNCGHRLIRIPVVFFAALAAGILTVLGIAHRFPAAPRWVALLASLVMGGIAFMLTSTAEIARHMGGPAPELEKSPVVARQERIDEMLGMRRTSEVRCRNGHIMQSFEDEGVLLAACPTCGIVKPYPGTMVLTVDLLRVAAKYDNFEA